MSTSTSTPGEDALARIDAILAARPQKDDKALSEATKSLCAYRDGMIAHDRTPDDEVRRRRLETLNSVLTVVLGLHFPMSEPPWDELVKARGWLAALLAEAR